LLHAKKPWAIDAKDQNRDQSNFEGDGHQHDQHRADYAYGSYGYREPGHARSGPFPMNAHSAGEDAGGSGQSEEGADRPAGD
jgi:hypothetical protein